MIKRLWLASALAATSFATQARDFSYDHVEAGYGEIKRGDSVFASASQSLDKNLYVLGGVNALDLPSDVNGLYVEGGLGYHLPLTATADFFSEAQLLYANLNHVGADDDDLGAMARTGVRLSPMPKLELEGALTLSANDFLVNDGLGLRASARYFLQPALSVALGLSHHTELDGAFVSLRYQYR